MKPFRMSFTDSDDGLGGTLGSGDDAGGVSGGSILVGSRSALILGAIFTHLLRSTQVGETLPTQT